MKFRPFISELDDKVLISESLNYLQNVLSKLLDTRSTQNINVNFEIDMRTFANFQMRSENIENHLDFEDGSPDRVILTEELVTENESLTVISKVFCDYLDKLPK